MQSSKVPIKLRSLKSILLYGLLIGSISVTNHAFAQGNDRNILLKGVGKIPLPDSPNITCAAYIFAEQGQVIAMAKVDLEKSYQLNVIVTSRLAKGKVIIFGSSGFLKQPMLNNKDIRQLLRNTIAWGAQKTKPTIQLWGQLPELQQFLSKEKYNLVLTKNNTVQVSTGILILTEDITDSLQIKRVENFVRSGGTLIFGSPLAAIYDRDPGGYPYLKFNDFLTTAGVYHAFNPISPGIKEAMIRDTVPAYLHISSILKTIQNNHIPESAIERQIVLSTIDLAIYFNEANTPVTTKLKQLVSSQGESLIVPSQNSPVRKSDFKRYLKYQLQQLLFDKEADKHPDPTYISRAGRSFPGEVPSKAVRITETVSIAVKVGSQGLREPGPDFGRWHSTSLYVPAGEKVTITIDPKDSTQHLMAQVGVHDDNLLHMDEFIREPYNLTKTVELNKAITEIYSPYGGILLINIPDTSSLKMLTLKVDSAVKYPYYKMGVTSPEEWRNTIRHYPAPWAELATDKIILTVPSYRITQLDDPEKLMKFWDEVMDTDAALANISTTRVHPERIIVDNQVAYGYMFTQTYKIVVPDDGSCKKMLDEQLVRMEGSWGHFHELGHRHQFFEFDFNGLGEVTVNLFSMYVFDKLLHKGIYNHENLSSKAAVIERIKNYMADNPSYEKWSKDPFTALCMYIEIIEGFGWHPIEQVFKEYRAMPKDRYPVTNEEKIDCWFKHICVATQRDLSAFFDKWQLPITAKVKKEVSIYPGWLPDELK